MEKKKMVAPMIIAILTLSLLVIGATYAYVNITSTNSFGTYTITSSVPSMGGVTITKGTNLTLNLTRSQVEKPSADTTYYAVTSGNPVTSQASAPVIATASVSGAGTFDCTYSLKIVGNPATMATSSVGKGSGLFVLKVNHYTSTGATTTVTYDMNDAHAALNSTTGETISGKITGLVQGTNKNITAQLYYKNSATIDQTVLAGTSATYTFTVTAFNCTATA